MVKTNQTRPPTGDSARPASADVPASTPLASPQEVIEQLHQRLGQERNVSNERRAERHAWVTDLTLVIEDLQGKPRTLEVTTHDISEGGFSFVYRQFIHTGTRILAHFGSVSGRPSLEGVVRNCAYVGNMHHRIGVQFSSRQEGGKKQTHGQPLVKANGNDPTGRGPSPPPRGDGGAEAEGTPSAH